LSDRIADVPRSFIREILKVTLDPTIISFAGGLPNRALFPVEELKAATAKVFDTMGRDVLQYSTSEGFAGLREMIARRYHERQNLDIPVEDILITNGSQQGLDLMGKTFINEGDDIVIEDPAYLGAIQAFSLYKPRFNSVLLTDEGMDINQFKSVMAAKKPKLIYTVPNFQNPSGLSFRNALVTRWPISSVALKRCLSKTTPTATSAIPAAANRLLRNFCRIILSCSVPSPRRLPPASAWAGLSRRTTSWKN
jgi:2-aminoadipate transaminase